MKKLLAILFAMLTTFAVAGPALAAEVYSSISIVDTYANVKIENIQLDGVGLSDTSTEHNTTYTVNGSATIPFSSSPTAMGDYYYRLYSAPTAEGVTADPREYIAWVSVYSDDAGNLARSVVLQEGTTPLDVSGYADGTTIEPADTDGYISKPTDVRFVDTKQERREVTRTITYTKNTATGETMFTTVTQKVTLVRTVACDANGNMRKDANGRDVVIGQNGNPIGYDSSGNPILCNADGTPVLDGAGNPVSTTIWQIDQMAENDLSAVTSPTDPDWYHYWVEAPDGATNKQDVLAWDSPALPLAQRLNLNDPRDVFEHVVYTPEPLVQKTEQITVSRTIHYREYDKNGDVVYRDVVQTVTLERTYYETNSGTRVDGTEGPWSIASPADGHGAVQTREHPQNGWNFDRASVPAWDDPTNPNALDLEDPRDTEEWVFYTPKPIEVSTEETKVTRTITYTEYTPDGREVAATVTQTVTLVRNVYTDPRTNKVTYGDWTYKEGDRTKKDSPAYPGWTPDNPTVPFWEIDFDDPKDEVIHVVYTPDPQPVEEADRKTITRTIKYRYWTADGQEAYQDVVQTVTLVRTKTTNPDGTVVFGPWSIEGGDQGAVESPKVNGEGRDDWVPNLAVVPAWEIDLNNPNSAEDIYVVYTHPNDPPQPVKTVEYREVTRTITFTELAPDGKEVSKTITQTVRVKRTKTEYPDGTIEYTPWEIDSDGRGPVDVPDHPGWTPNIAQIPEWVLDLDDVDNWEDEEIHVIYRPESDEPSSDPSSDPTPNPSSNPSSAPKPAATPQSPSSPVRAAQSLARAVVSAVSPKTGDPVSFVPLASLVVASGLLLVFAAKRRRSRDD